MTNTPRLAYILRFATLSVLVIAACNQASEPRPGNEAAKAVEKPAAPQVQSLPCDGPALTELAKQLDTAGGLGVDLGTAEGKAAIEAAISSINGKHVAFHNCVFTMQGNDEVSFAAHKGAKDVTCRMAGGESGNRAFRDAAMKFAMDKLRLDVTGVIASNGNPQVTRYLLTECTITPHE